MSEHLDLAPLAAASDAEIQYVILEHCWGEVHWDFLVEAGPALRTWAIAAPIEAGVERVARALPPHRRVYLDYEGPISGDRGTVRRWDRGVARVEVWTERAVRLRVRGVQLVGVVDFWEFGGETTADGPRPWRFRFGKLS